MSGWGLAGFASTVLAIAAILGAALVVFRAQGRKALVDLMEQRIRIQDGEIARLRDEAQRERQQRELLTEDFVQRIVTAVTRGVNTNGGSK